MGISYINHAVAGAFFVNFLLQAAMIGRLFNIYKVFELLKRWWRRYWAITPQERLNSNILDFFRYWAFLSDTLLALGIALSYTVIVPLVGPAALFYLFIRHCCDKNDVLVCKPKSLNQDGRLIPLACLFFMILLLWSQFYFVVFLYLKSAPVLMVLTYLTMPFGSGIVGVVLLYKFYRDRQSRIFERALTPLEVDLEGEDEADIEKKLRDAYIHPSLLPEADDPLSPESRKEQFALYTRQEMATADKE